MPHFSLAEAFTEATPNACKELIAQGIQFVTAVETGRGEWFLLYAYSTAHAGAIAHDWVDNMGARGASCWRIFEHGLASKPFATVYAQPGWDD